MGRRKFVVFKNQGKGKRKSRTARQSRSDVSLRPPVFSTTQSYGHVFRFLSDGGTTNLGITRKNLLNLYLVATSTTSTARVYSAVRLKRIRMWTAPASLGDAANTAEIEWVGFYAPSVTHSCASSGVEVGFLDLVPPTSSSDPWWTVSGSNETEILFYIKMSQYSTVDVHLTCHLSDNETATTGDVPIGATLGTFYFNYLDGISSGHLAPVGNVNLLPSPPPIDDTCGDFQRARLGLNCRARARWAELAEENSGRNDVPIVSSSQNVSSSTVPQRVCGCASRAPLGALAVGQPHATWCACYGT